MFEQLKEGEKRRVSGTITERLYNKKDGSPNYSLKIADKKGAVLNFLIWEKSSLYSVIQHFKKNDYVEIDVTLISKNTMDATLHYITQSAPPTPIFKTDELKDRLKNLILKDMTDVKLRRLIVTLINESWFTDKFFEAPASVSHGYSFTGGAFVRAMRMIEASHSIIDFYENWKYNLIPYPKMSKDLLTVAILFEESSKAYLHNPDSTNMLHGILGNETLISLTLLHQVEMTMIATHPEFALTNEERLMIQHLLSSMKGKVEFGAMFEAKTIEAMVLAQVVNLDMNIAHFEHYNRNESSDVVNHFDSKFFKGTYYNVASTNSTPKAKNKSFAKEIKEAVAEDEDVAEQKMAVNEFN